MCRRQPPVLLVLAHTLRRRLKAFTFRREQLKPRYPFTPGNIIPSPLDRVQRSTRKRPKVTHDWRTVYLELLYRRTGPSSMDSPAEDWG